MTVQNPPLYLQAADHPAEDFRHLITNTFGGREGVIIGGSLGVTEKSGTANMSVDVAEGSVAISGTEATYQGSYLCHNRGTTNLVISASDVTNDRYDLIVAQVEDSDYSGAVDAWKLAVVTGTPAATPLFPTVPDNAFVLSTVLVGNGVSSIVNADITDLRAGSDSDGTTTLANQGYLATLGGTHVTTSAQRPVSPHTGMEIYETDTDRKWIYSGSEWILMGGKLPYALISRLANFSVSSAVETDVEFDTATIDPDGMWDAGTPTEVIAPYDGMYTLAASVAWQESTTGYRYMGIQVNGSFVTLDSMDTLSSGLRTYQTSSIVRRVTAGSPITLVVRHTQGINISLQNGGPGNRLTVRYVGDYIS